MTSRLPDLLGDADLPLPELQAAMLDGDLVRVGDFYSAVDVLDGSDLRARALRGIIPDGAVALGGTAAWVWRATDETPSPHEVSVDPRGRRLPPRSGLDIREIALGPTEFTVIGRLTVTTPPRTLIDLVARARWRADEVRVAQTLIDLEGVSRASCDLVLERRRHVPHSVRSRRRLDTLSFIDQPGPTV